MRPNSTIKAVSYTHLDVYKRQVLKAAAGLLKPEGTLYFAAENAAGVRYWMGAERFDVSFLRA